MQTVNDKSRKINFDELATMKELIEYVLRFGILNKQQIALIETKITEVELKKDEYFSEAGKLVSIKGRTFVAPFPLQRKALNCYASLPRKT